MINAERTFITKLYNHFNNHPDSFYTWIYASPARAAICKDKLIRNCLLRYDTCCQLLFTLFEEYAHKRDPGFHEGFNGFLNDLKKKEWTVYYCELYNREKIIHPFIAQKIGANIQLYQSHPNKYSLYDSLNRLDIIPLSIEYIRDQFSYLESGQESYVQSSFKQLFHIKPLMEGRLYIRYKRCRHAAFSDLTLPKTPPNTSIRYIAFIFFVITAIIGIISIRHSAKYKS